MNELLDKQRKCLDLDINLFLAGLPMLVEQAKLGIPFISTGGTRLSKSVFAGDSPNVAPTDGGVMTLSGFKMSLHSCPADVRGVIAIWGGV